MLPEHQRWIASPSVIVSGETIVSLPPTELTSVAPRILVVDDEQYMCDLCSRTLSRASYDVTATTDPMVAQQLLHESSFDILLTDIQMPSVSGLDLAQQARSVDPAIVIIIMTGHASLENLQEAVRRGIAEFLSKPFELDQLRLAVDQALHKRMLLRENMRLQAMVQLLSSSDAINASLDLYELSRAVVRGALHETGYAAGALLLDDTPGLRVVVGSEERQEVLPAGVALAEQALDASAPQLATGLAPLLRDGAQSYLNGLALPLRAQGGLLGVLLLCDESVDRRIASYDAVSILLNQAGSAIRNAQQHRELQQTYTRLKELDHLKSEFVAVASHELRTPLSIVMGYTMMVREQLAGEQREYLQRVLDNAKRIQAIVDDMINLRYLQSGQSQLNLMPCDLGVLIHDVCEQIRPGATEKNQELRVRLPDPQVRCWLDHEKFRLVLSHLLANAVKFTGRAGWIELRAAVMASNHMHEQQVGTLAVQAQPLDCEQWIVVEVQDNGVGIPLKDQGRIFERFYQVADSLTRDHGGTGLGLAIVKELVTIMGGSLGVTSIPGQGSTFSLTLPLTLA